MKERKNSSYKEKFKGEREFLEEGCDCIPNIETEIENLMKEFYITRYDYKVTHFLVDLVQAEVLQILKNTKYIKKARDNNIQYDYRGKWLKTKNVRFEHKEKEKQEEETEREKETRKEESVEKDRNKEEGETEIDNIKSNIEKNEIAESKEKEKEEEQSSTNNVKQEQKEELPKVEDKKQMKESEEHDSNNEIKKEIIEKEEEQKKQGTTNMQINQETILTNGMNEQDGNIEIGTNEKDPKIEESNEVLNSLNKKEVEIEKDMEKENKKESEELLYVDDISVKMAIREYVLQNISRKKNVDFLYHDHTVNKYNEENPNFIERNITYPNNLPPYLPDDCSVNTILPSWDLNYIPNGLKN